MNLELKKAIDQISKDKGLDRDMLVDTLEDAVRTSVIRKYGENIDVEVSYNDDTGEIQVHQFKIVVDDVADPDTEIDIEKARELDPSVQLDDEIGFPLKVTDLGRIAAQSAKQVIIQRMRDAEQELIYEEFKDRVGEICSGIIQRRDKGGWIINLGRTEAILPKEEQIPREHYKRGDRLQALIIEVKKEGRGPQIVISRSHRDYTAALFRREVPEVDDGTVQIMGVARDPGSRAKVAVLSRERDVDPVGACVGVRGSRIQNIVQELHGERIDIVVWSPEISTYARNALAPAVISRIVVDEAENLLEVTVPDDQLTSAIGRKGQNVKLAAKLLGWKIDIFTETRYNETNAIGRGLEQVASVAEVSVDSLVSAGFTTLEQLQDATDEELSEKLSLSDSRIGDLRAAINFLSPVVGESADKADADALFLRGRAYFLQKNYEQAKVDFDAAVETKESYQLCLDIYELYQESSMKADGDRYLEAAVKIEPKTTEDYYNIGCAYYYLEEQDEAVKAFSKAMKDGSSAAMEMLGEVYLSNGQNDEAKALFSSYLSTDGFAAAANNGLALCALAENDTDSALSYIEEGLKTAEDSDRENLLFNQIVSYEKRADFDTAKSLMADFLAAYPENTAAQRENTFLQNR